MFPLRARSAFVAVPLVVGLAACGGGEKADTTMQMGSQQPSGQAPMAQSSSQAMSMPSWMKVDSAAKTVTLDISAGQTADNNHWNYNGYYNGNATITVPEGYAVTINFKNDDPALAHSIGVDASTSNFPAMFTNPQPAFPGAMSPNPTDPNKANPPGKTEVVKFTAAKAGNYALVCYIPGHALAGMWVHFDVSSDGSAGVKS